MESKGEVIACLGGIFGRRYMMYDGAVVGLVGYKIGDEK